MPKFQFILPTLKSGWRKFSLVTCISQTKKEKSMLLNYLSSLHLKEFGVLNFHFICLNHIHQYIFIYLCKYFCRVIQNTEVSGFCFFFFIFLHNLGEILVLHAFMQYWIRALNQLMTKDDKELQFSMCVCLSLVSIPHTPSVIFQVPFSIFSSINVWRCNSFVCFSSEICRGGDVNSQIGVIRNGPS